MRPRRRLLVALLLAGRVGAELDGLRRALGSPGLDRIAPHVTLVPPINVPERDLEAALGIVRAAAARRAPHQRRPGRHHAPTHLSLLRCFPIQGLRR